MINSFYEPHIHPDPDLPIIFHLDKACAVKTHFLPHCHENIEILYVIEGFITVRLDFEKVYAKKGDVVIVNSNCMHDIKATGEEASRYYCLIIDAELCENSGIYLEELTFKTVLKDKRVIKKYFMIKNEIEQKKALYKAASKTAAVDLMIYLCRHHLLTKSQVAARTGNAKMNIVKDAIKYMEENYCKNISTDDIAKEIGLSKSYFCRIFKETTRRTVISYLNHLRCTNAKKLLGTGKYLIGEAAFLSGFDNLSYFSKTYKRYMGNPPSESINDR